MIRSKICLFYGVLLFLSYSLSATAQDTLYLRTENLNVKDGLSQGLISDIIQDKAGFMWFGTKDGLNKYDGYNFTIYRYQQGDQFSLPDNYVTAISEDEDGNFWVGTNTKGLFLFDRKSERFYPVKLFSEAESLSFNTVFNLQSRNGLLLVQTSQMIIYDISNIKINSNSLIDFTKARIAFSDHKMFYGNSFPQHQISYFYNWMNDQKLWIINNDSVFLLAQNDNRIYHQVESYNIYDLGLHKEENYRVDQMPFADTYLFTGIHDLLVYNFKTKKIIAQLSFNDNYPFGRHLIKDKWGNFFITGLDRCYYFKVNDYSLLPVNGSIGTAGCLDDNGILWTITSGNGIIKLDFRKQLFQIFNHEKKKIRFSQ